MLVRKNAEIQAYIDSVCSQIKFREIHPEIRLELETHIDEIIEECLAAGLPEHEAVQKAITQMGSADIVGKKLNKVHKPKPEWGILTLGALFISIGLLVLYFIEQQGLVEFYSVSMFTRSLVFTVIAAAAAAGLYFFDYRKLNSYSKYIYIGTLLLLFITMLFGPRFSGRPYLIIGPLAINIVEICPFLFSIALAGILNKWDWEKPERILQGLAICITPLLVILAAPSFTAGATYSIACIILLSVSGVKLRNIMIIVGLIFSISMFAVISAPYRLERLLIFFNPQSDPSGSGWLNMQLSQLISSSGLLGQGFALTPGIIPELHTDFVFSYIIFTFGWLAGVLLAVMFLTFILRMVHTATIVKDNYAKMIISSFATIFAVHFTWNILMNLGLAPICGVSLPFISFGGSQLVLNAAALGIVLSIYKRRKLSAVELSQ